MWFRKERPRHSARNSHATDPSEGHLITEDMLVRGTISMRRGKPVRQIGVTVQGSTVLVTTGDIVDQETFDALVEARAIHGPNQWRPDENNRSPFGEAVKQDEGAEER
jgi:hypothetical protein